MKSPTLRVVVVGVGHWHAPRHLGSLSQLGHSVVGVTDHDLSTAQRIGGECGCRSGTDPVEMVEKTRPDLIVAMGVHLETPMIVDRLLDFRLPMLLEKPLGLNAGDAEPLVEKAERHALHVSICFPNRYGTLWRKMAELSQMGEFGEVSYGSFRVINGSPERYRQDNVSWMLDPRLSGGGSLINLGVHACDAFLSISGGPVEVVSAQLSNRIHRLMVEDYSVATLRSSTGIVGIVESGYSYPSLSGGDLEWRVVSELAYIQQGRDSYALHTLGGRHEEGRALSQAEIYHLLIEDAIERLRGDRPPMASMRDCLAAMRLIDNIYRVAGGLASGTGEGGSMP